MKRQHLISIKYPISWALILFGLYLTSLYSYLFFHSVAEIFGIVVACAIFMLAWNSRRFLDNNYLLFLGIAYLFVAVLDVTHTLAYTGMGVFPGYATNLPAQLWVAARYTESISLLIAPIFLDRRLKIRFVFTGYAAAVALLLNSILYWNIFPDCFVEGVGLTPFKKISEYIISLILLASIAAVIQKRKAFDTRVLRLLVASIIMTIASELSFTFYVYAYGLSNLIGHFFKIISFYLIYKAIIETGLTNPYKVLFRNLKQSEEVLRKSEARYRGIVEDQTELICRYTPDGTLTFVNEAYCRYFGKKGDELVGHKFMPFIPEEGHKTVQEYFASFSQENPVSTHEHRAIAPNGEIRWQQWANRALYDEQGHLIEFQSVGRDITERKRAEEALRKARDELEQRVKERTAELSESNVLLEQEIAEHRQAKEALQRSEAELRRLSSQLLNAQEEERKRIARELHDGIGQSLSAIKFKVETALNEMGQVNPAQVVKSLEAVVPVAQEAVEEVRRISRNLRPSILDDLGILATISWLCREVETIYSGIRIEKQIDIEEHDIPDSLKIVMYRVLQESFNNIAKHSHATLVRLSLKGADGKIELAIDDNGVGFDVEQVLSGEQSKRGIGLASMRERAELSGGSFSVESHKGAGTTVRASWPLSERTFGSSFAQKD